MKAIRKLIKDINKELLISDNLKNLLISILQNNQIRLDNTNLKKITSYDESVLKSIFVELCSQKNIISNEKINAMILNYIRYEINE